MAEPQLILTKYVTDITETKAALNELIDLNKKAGVAGVDSAEKVEKSEKELGKEVDKTGKKVKDQSTEFTKSAKTSGNAVNGLTTALKGLAAGVAAAFTVREVINFAKESVKAGNIQLQAEAQLLTALKGRKGAQQELIKQASDLQKITTFGDEETVAAQARIAAFVQEADQIKELTRVSQDFAAAKGVDLATASDLITKSFASSTNALSRYGIEIEGTAGSSERLTSIVGALDNAFKGQAEVIAKTGLGPVVQLQNAFSDLQEEIGVAIIKTLPGFTEGLRKGVDVASEFTKQLLGVEERTGKIGQVAQVVINFFDALKQTVRNLIAPFEAVFIVLGKVAANLGLIPEGAKGFDGALKIIEFAITRAQIPLQFVADLFLNILGVWNGVIEAFRVGSKTLTDVFDGIGRAAELSLKGKFGQAAEALKGFDFEGVGEAFNKGFQEIIALNDPKVKKSASEKGEEIGTTIADGVIDGLSDDLGGKIAEKLITQSELAAQIFKEQIEALDLEASLQIRFDFDLPEGEEAAFYRERLEQLNQFKAEFNKQAAELNLFGRTEEQQADIDALGMTTDEYLEAVEKGKQASIDAEREKFEAFQSAGQGVINVLGDISALVGEDAEKQRKIAFFQIVINQALAIAKAVQAGAGLQFPANLPAIIAGIAAVTSGFAQVKALEDSAPSFDVGTSSAPGGLSKVHKDELIDLPKGSVVYTAEASKKQRPLIDAINRGMVEDFIQRVYIAPELAKVRRPVDEVGGITEGYDDFNLRQAIRSNKEVELGPKTRSLLKPAKKVYH